MGGVLPFGRLGMGLVHIQNSHRYSYTFLTPRDENNVAYRRPLVLLRILLECATDQPHARIDPRVGVRVDARRGRRLERALARAVLGPIRL